MADSGGGSDWEVVSLTASTYAAAPGPGPIPVPPIQDDDAADKAESPLLLLPTPPSPPAHFFMSQHFNLPRITTHLENNNNGGQELEEESDPAVPDGDADHLNMPISPENYCQSQDVLVLASTPAGNGLGLQVEGGGDYVQQTSLPEDATAGSDATLPAPAPSSGVVPCKSCNAGQAQTQAWWEKTFSFPRQDGNGNGVAFRFVFVAGKLQIQEEDHLHLSGPVPGFRQTQKISCTADEPLGQVKVGILGGGSPVSQQG